MKLSVRCTWGTLRCLWRAGLCCDKLQVLCVPLVKCFVQNDSVYFLFNMTRKCLNHPDIFCYVCCELTFRYPTRSFPPLIKKCSELYYGCKVGDKDKSWAPHICCVTCVRLLTGWVNGYRQISFAVPMVWKQPKDHSSGSYLSLINVTRSPPNPNTLWNIHICHLQWGLYLTMESCLYQSLQRIWLVAMTVILMKIIDSMKEPMFTAIRHFKKVFRHLNHIYWHKEILTTLSVIWICLKTNCALKFPTKMVASSPPSY